MDEILEGHIGYMHSDGVIRSYRELPRDLDLVRLVAAVTGGILFPGLCVRGTKPDEVAAGARQIVAVARALLAEIDRPADGAKP